jgi:hypothetical protein
MKLFLKPTILFLFLFLAISCSDNSDDSCTPITCLNGGIQTTDCGCDCPESYTGSTCDIQVTPSSIRILRANVKKFPNFNPATGNVWDDLLIGAFTNPDLQLDILDANDNILFKSYSLDNRISSSNCDDENLFYPNIFLNSIDITSPLSIKLYDEDTSGYYELMGGYIFILYSSDNNFPNTGSIGSCSDSIVFELDLEYSW